MFTCLVDEGEISNEFHVDIGLSKGDTGRVPLKNGCGDVHNVRQNSSTPQCNACLAAKIQSLCPRPRLREHYT